jgi:hypothetical protein
MLVTTADLVECQVEEERDVLMAMKTGQLLGSFPNSSLCRIPAFLLIPPGPVLPPTQKDKLK